MPRLRQYFRIEIGEAVRGLEIVRLIEPVILLPRCIWRLLGALLCPCWEEHCAPMVALDSPPLLLRRVPKGEPAKLKIDLSHFKRYDWVLLNE